MTETVKARTDIRVALPRALFFAQVGAAIAYLLVVSIAPAVGASSFAESYTKVYFTTLIFVSGLSFFAFFINAVAPGQDRDEAAASLRYWFLSVFAVPILVLALLVVVMLLIALFLRVV